jgi:hypothetical protein
VYGPGHPGIGLLASAASVDAETKKPKFIG